MEYNYKANTSIIYKGEKHKNHMPKLNLRRTRKVITELSNFASCISTKPRTYLFSSVS